MMPIPDLALKFEIDFENKTMRAYLNNHFDSALFIMFLIHIEEKNSIQILDRKSHAQFGPHIDPNRYHVTVDLAGVLFEVRCVQMFRGGVGHTPEYTIAMKVMKA